MRSSGIDRVSEAFDASTHLAAWRGVPERWRMVIEGREPAQPGKA